MTPKSRLIRALLVGVCLQALASCMSGPTATAAVRRPFSSLQGRRPSSRSNHCAAGRAQAADHFQRDTFYVRAISAYWAEKYFPTLTYLGPR
jgi:hypothetical protein